MGGKWSFLLFASREKMERQKTQQWESSLVTKRVLHLFAKKTWLRRHTNYVEIRFNFVFYICVMPKPICVCDVNIFSFIQLYLVNFMVTTHYPIIDAKYRQNCMYYKRGKKTDLGKWQTKLCQIIANLHSLESLNIGNGYQ